MSKKRVQSHSWFLFLAQIAVNNYKLLQWSWFADVRGGKMMTCNRRRSASRIPVVHYISARYSKLIHLTTPFLWAFSKHTQGQTQVSTRPKILVLWQQCPNAELVRTGRAGIKLKSRLALRLVARLSLGELDWACLGQFGIGIYTAWLAVS